MKGGGVGFPASQSQIPADCPSFEDDFLYQSGSTFYGRWSVTQSNGSAPQLAGTDNQYGVCQLQNTAGIAGARTAISRGLTQFIIPAGVFWQFNVGLSIPTLSVAAERYIVRAGLMDAANAAPNNGVFFDYSDNLNAGQWRVTTETGGVATTNPTGTFATTGKVSLRAGGFSNSLALFNINGISVAGLSTNFPTGVALGLVIGIFNVTSAAQAHLLNVDYAALYYNVSR
jgi:hypothetical protein